MVLCAYQLGPANKHQLFEAFSYIWQQDVPDSYEHLDLLDLLRFRPHRGLLLLALHSVHKSRSVHQWKCDVQSNCTHRRLCLDRSYKHIHVSLFDHGGHLAIYTHDYFLVDINWYYIEVAQQTAQRQYV